MKFVSLLLGIILAAFTLTAQENDAIISALSEGDAAALSEHFRGNVELTLVEKDGTFSSNQAEIMLADFFQKNPPTAFETKHAGDSDGGSRYIIGNLQCGDLTYSTYLILKKSGDKYIIQELRFELE